MEALGQWTHTRPDPYLGGIPLTTWVIGDQEQAQHPSTGAPLDRRGISAERVPHTVGATTLLFPHSGITLGNVIQLVRK